jgi:hypothetical protein
MTPSQTLSAILSAHQFNTTSGAPRNRYVNLHIEGSPGVAKSSVVYQAAKHLTLPVIEFRFAGSDATDLKGIPDLKSGRTVWATPEELPIDPEWEGFIFFDEIVQGGAMVMSSVTELVLEGRMGMYNLPAKAMIVSAGNRRSDRAAVNDMPRHLADRFCVIPMEADPDDFCSWAATSDIRPEVISFIRAMGGNLSKFDPAQLKSPTPRGWSFVSSVLDMKGIDPFVQQTLIAGYVGEGAAVVFSGHLRLFGQIPTVEEILASPKTARVPDPSSEHGPAMCWAVATNLSLALNGKNAKGVVEYVDRFHSEEFGVLAIRDALFRDKTLRNVAEIKTWAARHSSLII